ncbi:hypothetical protein BCh11DRAFT_00598 [Burkholderia sp. Ch1-1]|nr:hypothetical protein BCh11DRAFT_00598 [Burkholderia sp. Ch1-1]
MFWMRCRQYRKMAAVNIEHAGRNRSVIVGRQIQRRWCRGLVATASVSTVLAIGSGFTTVGVAISVAAILPFAFFS